MAPELPAGGAGVTSTVPAGSSSAAAPAAEIDSVSELIPGVPASAANLAAMLRAFLDSRSLSFQAKDIRIAMLI